jgi:hypothetical protein
VAPTVALEAFKYAVDRGAAPTVAPGEPPTSEVAGMPPPTSVELSDPARLGPVWRGVFASILLAAAILIVLTRFFEMPGTPDSPASDGVFYTATVVLVVAFLIVVIGWGSVKVRWEQSGESES